MIIKERETNEINTHTFMISYISNQACLEKRKKKRNCSSLLVLPINSFAIHFLLFRMTKEEEEEERKCSYERYRTLVENECAGCK